MITLYFYAGIKSLILSTKTEFPPRLKKDKKRKKALLFMLSKQWESSVFLHCARSDSCTTFLWLSSPCQGRWGGPWKTLWRLVVGGSQGVWWPFHYSRSLPFHACPFPPSFPAEHLHRKGKYIGKGEAERVKLPTEVQRNMPCLQKQGEKLNIIQLVWIESKARNHAGFLCCFKDKKVTYTDTYSWPDRDSYCCSSRPLPLALSVKNRNYVKRKSSHIHMISK